MEHNTIDNNSLHSNTVINFMLTAITSFLGFISVNFSDKLKDIDVLLSPIVKVCSILSFTIFLILNWEDIKKKVKKFCKIK
jgi:predicted PurR-regulated permease PerM